MRMKFALLAATLLAAPVVAATAQTAAVAPLAGVKNIIIVINDGGGEEVYRATRYYLGRALVTDASGFQKTHVSTFPLRPDGAEPRDPITGETNAPTANTPTDPRGDAQEPSSVYNSAKFWNATPVPGPSQIPGYTTPFAQAGFLPITDLYPAAFLGYEWSRYAHPDSGNTASSYSSAVKTYNNAINVDGTGDPQLTIVELVEAAAKAGKVSGVVTTVEFSDATPAALGGAHNIARANRTAIADELFSTGRLTVIGGTGNPDYDDDSKPQTPNYRWVAQPLWTDLKASTNASGKNPFKFTLIQDREGIDAIATRKLKAPERLAMIMKSFQSTQFNRTDIAPGTIDARQDDVYRTPLKTAVPTQVNLTLAALNRLDRNGRGFYLMTEAGAVDRAEHANNTARMIEEQIDSDNTVKAIIDWVNRKETAATWDNTIMIVTADHDHLLYGPDGATVPFQPVQDRGPGKVPGNRWFGPNHGTGVVPFFAYGKAAAQLTAYATNVDQYKSEDGVTRGVGAYADQTLIGAVLKATAANTAVR